MKLSCRIVNCVVAVLAVAFLHGWAAGATGRMEGISPAELFPWASFDPAIPSPAEALGLQPGARPLRHGEVMQYLALLAASSPRAELRTYATTHEGRALVYLAVSEPEVIAELDRFREEHERRVDPRGRAAGDDATTLGAARAVAWIAYGIHGDELSSVDAAVAAAYWLVAGEDERAQTLRRELVILIDPMENPDGRDRYLAQIGAFAHRVPNPDSEDLSHTSVWPWGRGNHYLFDLNRDWFSMVHPESRRTEVIAGWEPQLVVDSHEMGADSTYLFPPPRHPFNPFLPEHGRDWWRRFAEDQARALDSRGYPYFTREWNEEFFPGYGSSWAAYRGAIGILWEMSRTSGTLVRKRSGELRTYPQAVEHHVTSTVANLETLAAHREAILRDFVADRRAAMSLAGNPVGAWVLPEQRNPDRTRAVVRLLRAQGIDVLRNDGTPNVSGLRDSRTGESVDASSLPGTVWLVGLDQPAAPLVRELLDPHVPMESGFFREEREYLERDKGTRLYEVTAWSLPLAFDVPAYWTPELPQSGWSEGPVPERGGTMVAVDDAVGYVTAGDSDASVAALADLLQRGIAVRVAEKPFAVEDRSYDRGALLVGREGNSADVGDVLGEVAALHGVQIHAVRTGLAETGPDLGGSHFKPLVAPRVGIWTGAPVSPPEYGALWFLMDEVLGLRFSGLDLSRFGRTDLSRYNVFVFPPVSGGREQYRALLGESGLKRLRSWIEAGGTAIGIGAGAEFLAAADSELTRTRLRGQALGAFPPVVLGPGAEEAREAGPFWAAGVTVRTEESGSDDEGDTKKTKKPAPRTRRESPYDVAPVLGPGARPFAAGSEQGTPVSMVPVTLAEWIAPLLPPRPPGSRNVEREDRSSYLEMADARLRRFSPRGAFTRVELDSELWLSWGLGEEVPALAFNGDALVARPPVQVAARFADIERLHLGGLLWPEAAGRLARTAYVTREGLGNGQVILFRDSPAFRGWTRGTRRLLINAMLYGPGLGTRWSTPW